MSSVYIWALAMGNYGKLTDSGCDGRYLAAVQQTTITSNHAIIHITRITSPVHSFKYEITVPEINIKYQILLTESFQNIFDFRMPIYGERIVEVGQ